MYRDIDTFAEPRNKARPITYKGQLLARVLIGETAGGNPDAMVFSARSKKPVANYYYRTKEARWKSVRRVLTNMRSSRDYKDRWKREKEERRAKFQEQIKVGDILYTSWGYDQTNVEFFQVIDKKGQFVKVREIAQSSEYSEGMSSMSDYRKGIKDKFLEDAPVLRKRILDGMIKIDQVRNAWPWDGKAKYNSWYA